MTHLEDTEVGASTDGNHMQQGFGSSTKFEIDTEKATTEAFFVAHQAQSCHTGRKQNSILIYWQVDDSFPTQWARRQSPNLSRLSHVSKTHI
jgi:hypothetical protein